ncbi:MAG: GtrA family protein [Candidimonas sp.]|nr:GtrA family protein [Candidimonas sp.]
MLQPKSKNLVIQLVKFSLVGLLNTVSGFSIILVLMWLGYSPYLSNFVGYIGGLCLSFILNKRLVFLSRGEWRTEALKFFTSFLIAYSLNFFTLYYLITFGLVPIMAQTVSIVMYFLVMFILTRQWVYKK